MCTFVTAIVPSETDLRQLCEKHGFEINPMDNVSLHAITSNGYQFLPVGGSCNCDEPLGYSNWSISQPHNLESDISKLKRKGWSSVKIQRWIIDKKRTEQQQREQSDKQIDT